MINYSRQIEIKREFKSLVQFYGSHLALKLSLYSRIPTKVVFASQVTLHCFLEKISPIKFNLKQMTLACLWLSCKLEDYQENLEPLLNIFHELESSEKGIKSLRMHNIFSRPVECERMKSILNWHEITLLREIGFYKNTNISYQILLPILKLLTYQNSKINTLYQDLWTCVSDLLRTDVFLNYSFESILSSIVQIVSHKKKIALTKKPQWWKIFGVCSIEIHQVMSVLSKIYLMPARKTSNINYRPKRVHEPVERFDCGNEASFQSLDWLNQKAKVWSATLAKSMNKKACARHLN